MGIYLNMFMFTSASFTLTLTKYSKLRDILVAQDTHDNMGKWDINELTLLHDLWRLKKQCWMLS